LKGDENQKEIKLNYDHLINKQFGSDIPNVLDQFPNFEGTLKPRLLAQKGIEAVKRVCFLLNTRFSAITHCPMLLNVLQTISWFTFEQALYIVGDCMLAASPVTNLDTLFVYFPVDKASTEHVLDMMVDLAE
jgi:hypothetical protein